MWFSEDLSLEDFLIRFLNGAKIFGICAGICAVIFLCLHFLKTEVDRRQAALQINGLNKLKIDCVISLGGIALGGIVPRMLVLIEPPGLYMKYYGLVIYPFYSVVLIRLFLKELGLRYKIHSENHKNLLTFLYFLHFFFFIYTIIFMGYIYNDLQVQESVFIAQMVFLFPVAFSTVDLVMVLTGGVRDSLAPPNVRIQKADRKVDPVAQPLENDPRIECKICLLEYNDNTRTPRILRDCGHTVCQECAQKFLKKFNNIHLFCPFCQQISVVKGPATLLAKNFFVTDFMWKLKNENN